MKSGDVSHIDSSFLSSRERAESMTRSKETEHEDPASLNSVEKREIEGHECSWKTSLSPILQEKECEKTILKAVSPKENYRQTTTYRVRERRIRVSLASERKYQKQLRKKKKFKTTYHLIWLHPSITNAKS